MTKLLFCVLICVFGSSYALVGQKCTTQDECDQGECCQILSEFMVVSRRQLEKASLLTSDKTGTCQLYKTEGEHCNGFDKMNGYCSCGPDLKCWTREEPIKQLKSGLSATPRKMAPPRPGYTWVSTCEKA